MSISITPESAIQEAERGRTLAMELDGDRRALVHAADFLNAYAKMLAQRGWTNTAAEVRNVRGILIDFLENRFPLLAKAAGEGS